MLRIDPVTNLGLSAESVFSYHIGDIVRNKDSEVPELLPIGYLVGDTMQIGICLKGNRICPLLIDCIHVYTLRYLK